MGNEIATREGPAGRAERLDGRDLDSIPGRYFTALDDIPAREEQATRKADRWSGHGHDTGSYEVSYRARRAVSAGTSLLAVKLNFLDDALHSVVFAAHPADPDKGDLAFMADEFFRHFAEEPDGEAVRGKEIAGVQEEISRIQKALAAPDPAVAGFLPAPSQRQPSATDLVAAVSRKENLEQRALAIQAAAEARSRQIEEGTKAIAAQTALLGAFYQEKAKAALATVGDQIRFARSISEGVKTLSLYTGEGVTVRTVMEGEAAPAEAPLTLYQSRLYLDEELAVQSLTGGFDFQAMDDLGDILAADPRLLDRMIPVPRGAVLVRVRRESKEYFSGQGNALADAMLNLANQTVYLLVRNGSNVHLVHSELTTDAATRLFPTRAEIDEAFRRHGMEVRPEHLDYSRARDEFEKSTVFYKRMLLLLWGLSDRLALFGSFYDPAAYRSWYDPAFQADRLAFVHDEEGVLEHRRPSFREWMDAHNRELQAGSRVAVVWKRLANPDSAPAMFSPNAGREGHHSQLYAPASVFSVAVAERRGDRLAVTCEASGTTRSGKRRTLQARVDLALGLDDDSGACICIDRVTVADLDWYLNSRRERRNYERYFHLFEQLRGFLADEEARQAPALRSLGQDMAHARLDPETSAEALARAVSLWRAQNGGRLVGGEGWTEKDRRAILDVAYALAGARAGARGDLMDRVRTSLPGARPVELRVDGKAAIWLVREPHESELSGFERHVPPAFLTKVQLRIGRTGVSETGKAQRVYFAKPKFDPSGVKRSALPYSPVREEPFLTDEVLASKWAGKSLPGWPKHETMLDLWAASSIEAPVDAAEFDAAEVERQVRAVIDANRSGSVASTWMNHPVGFYSWQSAGSSGGGVGLLCVEADGLMALAAIDRGRAESVVKRYYKHPENKLSRLASVRDGQVPFTLCKAFAHDAKLHAAGGGVHGGRDVSSRAVSAGSRGWFGGKATVHASIAASIRAETCRHVDDGEDCVRLYWPSERNRLLAERLFAQEARELLAGDKA